MLLCSVLNTYRDRRNGVRFEMVLDGYRLAASVSNLQELPAEFAQINVLAINQVTG